jgi:hypothetical protein
MVDSLSGPYFAQNPIFIRMQFRWDNPKDGLTYNLIRRVSKNPVCGTVPAEDDSVQVLADYCVVGGVNNCSEMSTSIEILDSAVPMFRGLVGFLVQFFGSAKVHKTIAYGVESAKTGS